MSALRRERDSAYQALADGTRRELLELLAQSGPLRAGEIAAHFPRISRPAVSRHLRVLREAGLIEVLAQASAPQPAGASRDGREQWYRANPAPLDEVAGWVARYKAYWSQSLDELARLAERPR